MNFTCRSFTWRPVLARIRSQSTKSGVKLATTSEEMTISPLELREEHVGQMYCMSSDDVKTAFPTSLPRLFAREVGALREACWLLRRQSYDIIQDLRSYEQTQPHNFRYLLYGGDGTGKTMCMHQILHYCVKAGWLVVFIPGVFAWTHSRHELRPSPHVPGTFDQPEAASSWLKTFRALNSTFTAQLCLSKDYQWSKKDHSTAGEEFTKVIDTGLLKPVLATEIVKALLQELVLVSHRFKIVLAVDEFNGCFSPTTLKNPQKEWVLPHQLNLVRCLLQHVPQFPGAVLLSLSRARLLRCSTNGWRPNDLLMGGAVPMEMRAEAEAILESCGAVEVPQYSRQELENCLSFYSQRRWINRELSAGVVNELWHLTSGRPNTLHRMCASL